ncbi:MAG: DUF4328 domain-containing protein [Erythrobacter sp.]|nr:DUF4328 domain-containing protein [Erythrobacter sp.]NCQ64690.1 DUF4328 domain-containing protein [Alphaproteobacteria bacterium]
MTTIDATVAPGGADDDSARLHSRARNATIAIYATIAVSVVVLVFELLELAGIVDLYSLTPGPLEEAYYGASLLYTLVFFVSVVFVAMWIYRAHANLRDRGIELTTSPGWAVGWYFIPIANLFKPFQAMRELWSESHLEDDSYGDPAPGEITAWWACWIVGNILANVSMRMTGFGDGSNLTVGILLGAASGVLTIAAAILLRNLVRDITAAQTTHLNLREVFE